MTSDEVAQQNGTLRRTVFIVSIIAVLAPVAVAWGMLLQRDLNQQKCLEDKLDKEYFLLYKESVDVRLDKIEVKIDEIHHAIVGSK